jgi:hypothetical protein
MADSRDRRFWSDVLWGSQMKASLRRIPSAILAISLSVLTTGCSNRDGPQYVGQGDIFFDDAMTRLSPTERERLKLRGLENIRGFSFRGTRHTCIVILSLRNDLISHDPSPAFCYDNKTNQFEERL